MNEEISVAIEVLTYYGIQDAAISPINTGLINRSWQVSHNDSRYVLQKVNSIFGAEIHSDIARVTEALTVAGLATPRLLSNGDGAACYEHVSGTWRLYSFVEGITVDQVSSTQQASEAGRILSQFHRVLAGLDITFMHERPGAHNLQRHLLHLTQSLDLCHDHPRYDDIHPLAGEILDVGASLPVLDRMPDHKVHGDPKINNILFDPDTGKGLCMVDFDTMTDMPLALELGDAMRSWCNPAGEDSGEGLFEPGFFHAGLEAYLHGAHGRISKDEIKSILPATAIIYIELASRFCADALNEDYFGWDPQRFDSHSQHSETRAISQLNCYWSLSRQYAGLETMVDTLLQR